jgi:hypothetical protein
MEPEEIRLSPMPKTWILDLDGTLVVHNGPYILGRDVLLQESIFHDKVEFDEEAGLQIRN